MAINIYRHNKAASNKMWSIEARYLFHRSATWVSDKWLLHTAYLNQIEPCWNFPQCFLALLTQATRRDKMHYICLLVFYLKRETETDYASQSQSNKAKRACVTPVHMPAGGREWSNRVNNRVLKWLQSNLTSKCPGETSEWREISLWPIKHINLTRLDRMIIAYKYYSLVRDMHKFSIMSVIL